jgi:hypothetical protein
MFGIVDFFHVATGKSRRSQAPRGYRTEKPNPTMAQPVAEAASAFEHLRTGHDPESGPWS